MMYGRRAVRLLTFVLAVFVVALLGSGASAAPTTQYVYDSALTTSDTHRASSVEGPHDQDIRAPVVAPNKSGGSYDARLKNLPRASERPGDAGFAPNTTGVLVEGAGSGTRALNFRPHVADPNWGLTKAHLDKHLFGSGSSSLRQIDAAGNPDLWRTYIQDLAGRPATAHLKGGIEDVIGTFPKADGSGTFQFGVRIAPGSGDTWDLVTLLTKQ